MIAWLPAPDATMQYVIYVAEPHPQCAEGKGLHVHASKRTDGKPLNQCHCGAIRPDYPLPPGWAWPADEMERASKVRKW